MARSIISSSLSVCVLVAASMLLLLHGAAAADQPALRGYDSVSPSLSASGDTFVFNCTATGTCAGNVLACPPGKDCEVYCHGFQVCQQTTVKCPPSQKCSTSCGNVLACQQITIECAKGASCDLTCDASFQSCEEGTMTDCGTNDELCCASCASKSSCAKVQCSNAAGSKGAMCNSCPSEDGTWFGVGRVHKA